MTEENKVFLIYFIALALIVIFSLLRTVYFKMRRKKKDKPQSIQCPHCGTMNPSQNTYCSSCGELLNASEGIDTLLYERKEKKYSPSFLFFLSSHFIENLLTVLPSLLILNAMTVWYVFFYFNSNKEEGSSTFLYMTAFYIIFCLILLSSLLSPLRSYFKEYSRISEATFRIYNHHIETEFLYQNKKQKNEVYLFSDLVSGKERDDEFALTFQDDSGDHTIYIKTSKGDVGYLTLKQKIKNK